MIGSGIHVVNYDECIQNQGLHAFWLNSKSSCLFCAKNMYTMFKHRVKYCILQSQWLLETTKETKTALANIFMKVI